MSITPINLMKIKKECENTFVKKKINQFPLPVKPAPQKQPFFQLFFHYLPPYL